MSGGCRRRGGRGGAVGGRGGEGQWVCFLWRSLYISRNESFHQHVRVLHGPLAGTSLFPNEVRLKSGSPRPEKFNRREDGRVCEIREGKEQNVDSDKVKGYIVLSTVHRPHPSEFSPRHRDLSCLPRFPSNPTPPPRTNQKAKKADKRPDETPSSQPTSS